MRYILLITILYLYIYNPVFTWLGFGFVNIMMGLSLLYAIFNFRIVSLYLKSYRTEFVLSLVMFLYVTIICSMNGTDQIGLDLLVWIVSTVFVPIFLIETFIHRQKKLVFWDVIILVGFIASLISCSALFYPPFNAFLRSIQVVREYTDFSETQFSFRYFGLAINLSNAYGYVQGLLASLCILRLDKNHKRYALYFITLVISIVVNARTGLFPIALTLLYVIIKATITFDIRNFAKLVLGGIVLFSFIIYILSLNKEIGDFVYDFYIQIDNMFFNDNSEFEDSVYYTMIHFPETIQGIIFGEGRSLFNEEVFENSDIGYVNQLFIGGIIFVSMLLLYEYIIYHGIRQRSKENVFSTIFFISILVFNYKGVSFYASSAYMKLWMLYYFVLIHNLRFPMSPIKLQS